jgi:hypothetical protein
MIKSIPIIDVNTGKIIEDIQQRKKNEINRKKQLEKKYKRMKNQIRFDDKRVKVDEYKIFARIIQLEFPGKGSLSGQSSPNLRLYKINRQPKTRVTIRFYIDPEATNQIREIAEAYFGAERIISVDGLQGNYSSRTYPGVFVRIRRKP